MLKTATLSPKHAPSPQLFKSREKAVPGNPKKIGSVSASDAIFANLEKMNQVLNAISSRIQGSFPQAVNIDSLDIGSLNTLNKGTPREIFLELLTQLSMQISQFSIQIKKLDSTCNLTHQLNLALEGFSKIAIPVKASNDYKVYIETLKVQLENPNSIAFAWNEEGLEEAAKAISDYASSLVPENLPNQEHPTKRIKLDDTSKTAPNTESLPRASLT
jgi:hypothetical protein